MDKGVTGFLLVGGILLLLALHGRPAPKIDNAEPAKTGFPRLHLWRGESDADRSLDIKDTDGGPRGRVLERDGVFYDPHGTTLETTVVNDLYLVKTHWDVGTFAGYRNASRGVEDLDPLTAGLRFSPVRLGYDVIAPDLVLSSQWAGAGFSFYLPGHLAGPHWKHLGVGFWYGYPFHGSSDSPGGWTAGLSYSIR